MPVSSNKPIPRAVNEHDVAHAFGVSVHWLRRDRITDRVVPFYRVKGRVLYSLDRVQQAFAAREEGGAGLRSAKVLA